MPTNHIQDVTDKMPKWLRPTFRRFCETLQSPEDLAFVLLKGHLLIEEKLDSILCTIVAHGEYLDKARLTFHTKAVVAQSMSWSQHANEMWKLVYSINTLRNQLAHSLEPNELESKLGVVLNTHAEISKNDPNFASIASLSSMGQLYAAIVYCLGFLTSYERDAQFYRKTIDSLYKTLSEIGEHNKSLESDAD